MKAYYCHQFALPLPHGHRFPMDKYRRLHRRVADCATRLGIDLCEPPAAGDDDLLRAHSADYVQRVVSGALSATDQRRIGFPWSRAMVERSRRSSGGTMMALAAALRGEGVAVNLAGGTHHASADQGGGYCVFNDSVIAARHAQALGLARRVLVVDLDVHQGNGTAALCRDDATIYTFSMHAARNYPARKEPGDLDVELEDGCGDAEYLDRLAAVLPRALRESGADAVLFLAGADPYGGDRLGRLALTKPGLRERDRMVLEACRQRGLAVAVSMAGGYAEDIDDIVDIHFATVELAARYARAWPGSAA
jgi:acetoin utilization deacetylase AcuC-like enzyme